MGGGYWNANKNDTDCNTNNNECPDLFDKNYGNDEKSYNEWGLGVAYWIALVAGVLAIVTIIFSIFAAGESALKK